MGQVAWGNAAFPTGPLNPQMPRWSVDIIRHRSENLGTVIAANEKEATKAAIAIYQIEPARWNRITVTKVSDKDDNEG